MRRTILIATAVLAVVPLHGCGSGAREGTAASTLAPTTTDLPPDDLATLEHDADRSAEGVGTTPLCRLLPVARVERIAHLQGLTTSGTDSTDQSTCRYGRGEANVRVILDGAPDATRRFFNMQAEAEEFRSQGTAPPTQLVQHVGDDSTYGDAGAYWTPGRERFVAYRDDRIAKLIVHLPGRRLADERRIAIRVTRRLFAALPAQRSGD